MLGCGLRPGQVAFQPAVPVSRLSNGTRTRVQVAARQPHHAGKGRAKRDEVTIKHGEDDDGVFTGSEYNIELRRSEYQEPGTASTAGPEEIEKQWTVESDIEGDSHSLFGDDEESGPHARAMEDEDEDEDDEDDDDDDYAAMGGGQSLLDVEEPFRRDPNFQEAIVQVRRVTKVARGGKQLKFRVVVVIGNGKGTVGVGCGSAREVQKAVEKAIVKARQRLVTVPRTRTETIPHEATQKFKGAKVTIRPASVGTGVIAGGAVRQILELAGVRNAFGKQHGCNNALNNAKATILALQSLTVAQQASQLRRRLLV